jgi:hypothetical protein
MSDAMHTLTSLAAPACPRFRPNRFAALMADGRVKVKP